jgi:hypothetical protein
MRLKSKELASSKLFFVINYLILSKNNDYTKILSIIREKDDKIGTGL